jgi:DNA helicase-2/ATP-dependent DNA helicase PcrA
LALERIEVLRRFLDEARTLVGNRPEATLGDWLAYLDTLKEHNLALEAARLGESAGIRLLTAHRAKGLEFDHVFIIGARDGHWGNRHRPTYFSVPSRGEVIGDKLDDERRLFYVALTRAREAVYISYAEADESGNPALPAQFVEEIDKNLIETVDVSDLEEGWAVTPDFGFRPAVDSSLSATDREYLVQLFRRRGLSVTALNNYLDCPWKYFFKNLLRLPETRSRTLLYGTAVHETLEKLFKLYQKRGELPDQRLFLSLFTEALMRQPLTRTDFELSLAKGQVALLGYYEKYKKEWSSRVITEYSLTVPAWHEGVALTGKLDKLELSGDNLVNVVDYKTGGVKSRNEIEGQTKHSNGRLKRQLVFYKLLLDGDETKRYHFASAEIDFVEPAPSGAYKKEKFIITEAEAKTLAEQTKKVINGILNLDFWGQTCSDRDCEYCQLRKLLNY